MREKVVEANRRFYSQRSHEYHGWRSDEEYLAAYSRMFERHMDQMRCFLPNARAPRVLDCCAGSGLLSEQFTRAGCEVTALDVAPEMLAICAGRAAHLVEGEVSDFLLCDERAWDVIAFGSAVHHIWNYDEVLRLANERLSERGALLLIREPIRQATRSARALREVELVWRKLASNPRDAVPAIKRRVTFETSRGKASQASGSEHVPDDALSHYAEIHAHGLDMARILEAISDLEVVHVEGYRSGGPLFRGLKLLAPGYESDNIDLLAVKRG